MAWPLPPTEGRKAKELTMLSAEENKLLTEVGPGTPMGGLMRRYWFPVAAYGEILNRESRTLPVRLLGEDFVLFQEPSGKLGLLGRYCTHRGMDLVRGFVEEGGIRCIIDGWKFTAEGRCVDRPLENDAGPPSREFDNTGHPVQEFGGLVWGYIGPEPAPLLPRWRPLLGTNDVRDIGITDIPCNWLQLMENSMDPTHVEWLHGYFGSQVKDDRYKPRKHQRIGFDPFRHGIIKRRLLDGQTEDDDEWRTGHPVLFPNTLYIGDQIKEGLQIRVPVDDIHTRHYWYSIFKPAPGAAAPKQDVTPHRHVPIYDEDGKFITTHTTSQDYMVALLQGPIVDRTMENLGESDRGIIMYRRLLKEQMAVAEDGGDPMNVIRDAVDNESLDVQVETVFWGQWDRILRRPFSEPGESPGMAEIRAVLETWRDFSPGG